MIISFFGFCFLVFAFLVVTCHYVLEVLFPLKPHSFCCDRCRVQQRVWYVMLLKFLLGLFQFWEQVYHLLHKFFHVLMLW